MGENGTFISDLKAGHFIGHRIDSRINPSGDLLDFTCRFQNGELSSRNAQFRQIGGKKDIVLLS